MSLEPQNNADSTIKRLLDGARKQHEAELRQGFSEQPKAFTRFDIDLSTYITTGNQQVGTQTNPFLLNFPFDGIWVLPGNQSALGATVGIAQLQYGANKGYNNQTPLPLSENFSCKFDSLVLEGRLWWTLQTGSFISIILFQGNDVRPGIQALSISNRVQLQVPPVAVDNTLGVPSTSTTIPVTSGTPIAICGVNLKRAQFSFYTDQDIWVSPITPAIGRGVLVKAGQQYIWTNSFTLFAIAAATTANVCGIEESYL